MASSFETHRFALLLRMRSFSWLRSQTSWWGARLRASRTMRPPEQRQWFAISTSMASSFETHRFAKLLRMRSFSWLRSQTSWWGARLRASRTMRPPEQQQWSEWDAL